ncbi:quinone-dependent dihydroorotate dehydrogenase [Bacteroides mediterraneensis]|uniref:quinone-dependent dihydroorotate dehydrogenase n=1 Tax=Bacteroides mediterraneensis TaxID=1841856 RepID=UPI0026EEB87E|nr:quinone-dependent dihydroorotate dehydrogenase [Bacteroides mediterraneensis]
MYQSILRPWLFRIDAEKIHNQIISLLHVYRHLPLVKGMLRAYYRPKAAPFQWRNLTFGNRVGLSAGFDKEASCFDELSDLGFGFLEVGTVTPEKVAGNPSPRIFRLPEDHALVSRTGFNNPGKEVVLNNLQRKREGKYILGVNINTNTPADGERAAADITSLYEAFSRYADYYTVNWGSMTPEILAGALTALESYKQRLEKPVFLKLPADVPLEKLEGIITFAKTHHLDGFIATGPTQDRSLLIHSSQSEVTEVGAGGISGLPVIHKSVEVMKYLSAHAPQEMLLIGAGGVMTPLEADAMRNAGAHLVQIYSAFIYEGPGIIKRIAEACNE